MLLLDGQQLIAHVLSHKDDLGGAIIGLVSTTAGSIHNYVIMLGHESQPRK